MNSIYYTGKPTTANQPRAYSGIFLPCSHVRTGRGLIHPYQIHISKIKKRHAVKIPRHVDQGIIAPT